MPFACGRAVLSGLSFCPLFAASFFFVHSPWSTALRPAEKRRTASAIQAIHAPVLVAILDPIAGEHSTIVAALKLAQQLSCGLHVLVVIPILSDDAEDLALAEERASIAPRLAPSDAERLARTHRSLEALKKRIAFPPSTNFDVEFDRDFVAATLACAARFRAQMILTGRGKSPTGLRSDTLRLVHASPLPVVLLPPAEDPDK